MKDNKFFLATDIAVLADLDVDNIINIYFYGSRVYGTASLTSDFDFICIIKNPVEEMQISKDVTDVTFYTEESFLNQIKKHEISCLECLWLPSYMKYETKKYEFELHLPTLREAVSAKCSNSFVKSKKKLIVEDSFDPYVGKKSLWHCFRMSEFGRQIATSGKIETYDAVNFMLPEIMAMPDDWEVIKEKFQPLYNRFMSNFRLVAPKG